MIRWGIVGCGNVCEVKSGPAFQRVADSSLVAVMRRDGAAAADFARRHGVPKSYDDAAKLINDPEVDAVYVAAPVDGHERYALAAAAAGKPCYVEKPMARNHAECARMVAAFAAKGLPLFVAYYRRGLPRFITARDLIAGGRIGRLTGITYRYASPRHRGVNGGTLEWRLSAQQSGGGLFLDLGSHALDIIAFIAGDLSAVAGVAANRGSPYAVEDTVALSALAGDRVPLVAAWDFAAHAAEDVIRFSGTDGELTLSVFGDEALRLRSLAGDEDFNRPNPKHIQEPLIATIVEALHGRGACPLTGVTAARTSLVMDTVLSGYYGGREDGFWTREATWPGRIAATGAAPSA